MTQVADALRRRFSSMSFIVDVQQRPGDPVPPLIADSRPDVYATDQMASSTIIAEGKTVHDLDNKHTYKQLVSFATYLEHRSNGSLFLSVSGCAANRAKTLLRIVRDTTSAARTNFVVFDGCDFWTLALPTDTIWHLN